MVSSIHSHFEIIFVKDDEEDNEREEEGGEAENKRRHENSGDIFRQFGLIPLILSICELSNTSFDKVMSWSICQTFYIASYLITKRKYEENLIKQMQMKSKK